MAYLITCAGSKRKPIIQNPSNIQDLAFHQILGNARRELLELNPQIKLDWNYTLPAWQLYSGNRSKIYPQISGLNWEKGCVEIRILSALFGWVKHTDLLPNYDLRMSDKIPGTKQMINKYWYSLNLLSQFINQNDIDLLSGDYRKAVHGNANPVSEITNELFNDYGVQKGKWLNNQLEKLICK
jgi:cytoplasmic iron level regulating protein YaaA (DUF328/UPF0246 family)